MQLKHWLANSDTSIKAFARAVNVERAMIYRYFLGTVPRARVIRRIEIITEGAVTAQDFYTTAMQRLDDLAAQSPEPAPAVPPEVPAEVMAGSFGGSRIEHAPTQPAAML